MRIYVKTKTWIWNTNGIHRIERLNFGLTELNESPKKVWPSYLLTRGGKTLYMWTSPLKEEGKVSFDNSSAPPYCLLPL